MANIGSAFLGDLQAQRIRQLSSPTLSPPSSPSSAVFHQAMQPLTASPYPSQPPLDSTQKHEEKHDLRSSTHTLNKTTIDPELALELRVRWLEALVLGHTGLTLPLDASTSKGPATTTDDDRPGRKGHKPQPTLRSKVVSERGKERKTENLREKKQTTASLARLTEDVKKRLDTIVDTNEGLRKFMNTYDQYSQYMTPAFALAGIIDPSLSSDADGSKGTRGSDSSLLPTYENLSPQELEAYLAELEPDVRAADRDMQEIEALVAKGVLNAGKLGDYEALKPRLSELIEKHEEDVKLASELEKRVARLVERHVTQVDALSELFVAWDDTLLEAEGRSYRLARDAQERQKRGLE